MQAIRKSIEDCGGYEESSADDVIQAVIPVANYADFLEQGRQAGRNTGVFPRRGGRRIAHNQHFGNGKIKRDTVDFYEKSRVLFLLKFSWGQRILICFCKK